MTYQNGKISNVFKIISDKAADHKLFQLVTTTISCFDYSVCIYIYINSNLLIPT